MLKVGTKGTKSVMVTSRNTAKTMGSGTLDVFATPALAALMEEACQTSVAGQLEPGSGTVGTLLEIRHTAPTPLGMEVSCESMLVEADGRRLVFEVRAGDAKGSVGEGRHERVIIREESFQEKANAKRDTSL